MIDGERRTGFGLLTERDLLEDLTPAAGVMADSPANQARRAELMGSLPDRVVTELLPEDLLDAGPRPVFSRLALASLLSLLALGVWAYRY